MRNHVTLMAQPDPISAALRLSEAGDMMALARRLSPHLADDDVSVSPMKGKRNEALSRLDAVDPIAYGKSRNFLDGAVTRLSPYIRHGVLSLSEVRDHLLDRVDHRGEAEKLVQQLAWRDYWQRLYVELGRRIWDDLEDYKTGFSASDYTQTLPDDIARAETGVAAIDHFILQLTETGWLHNHARLYLAAYICHFRRISWQAGARFFLAHLIDGDPASNNLSWQWVASTFSHKPYYFNLDNLQRFCGSDVDTSYKNNRSLAGSYEALHVTLFPNLDPPDPRPQKARSGKDVRQKQRVGS